MGSPTGDEPRLVVVCGYPPTTTLGGGVILRSLLEEYPRDRLTVVANARLSEGLLERGAAGGLLEVPHVGIRPWRSHVRGLRRLFRSLNVLQVVSSARRIAHLAGDRGVVLTLPWGGELGSELFVAAYRAHLRCGAGLLVYEVDEWGASLGSASGRLVRLLERTFHRRILRAAGAVWAMNEFLADVLRQKAGVTPIVVPYCLDLSAAGAPRGGERANEEELRIVYTGAVYGAQADAIRNVARALSALRPDRSVLEIYTDASPAELAALGISGECVRVNPLVPPRAVLGVLRAADVLLLPLSFEPAQQSVVATSFPTKTAEYLASGVPILTHAPPYATVVRAARAEGWALVVDQPSPTLLQGALDRLRRDEGLRRQLSATAVRVARERHDLATRRTELMMTLRGLVRPTPATS